MNRLDIPREGFEPEPLPEMDDRLDDVVVRLPLYEPSGGLVEITGRALCNHGLLLGQTGSGKTSVLRWFIKSLINHRSAEVAQKPGIFVFDFNADDTPALITRWAHEAGRKDDLRFLSAGEGHLDLFATIRRLDHLSTATSYLMNGPWASHLGDNAYWTETVRTLLDAGLTLCFAVEGKLKTATVLRFLRNWLISKQTCPDDDALLAAFEKLCRGVTKGFDRDVVAKLELSRATLEMWAKLDTRTKGILTSIVLDALGPFIATEAHRYFDESRLPRFDPEELHEGRIMVFSLPAALQVETASLLGKIIKARLWATLQQRPQERSQRLCVVISDEYHYLASGGTSRSSDVTALATLRSRCVAVVAATQSLDHLAGVMSPASFRALLPNFGSHFFFRSTEAHTSELATAIMGTRPVRSSTWEEHENLLVGSALSPATEMVCPPGALTQLQPCQAYVSIAGGERRPELLWLGANHERATVRHHTQPALSPDDALQKLREEVLAVSKPVPGSLTRPSLDRSHPSRETVSETEVHYDEGTWHRLLQERRFQRSPFRSFAALNEAFLSLGQRPIGLETLPPCWWTALVRLTAKFSRQHPLTLLGLQQVEGCLRVTLSGIAASEVYLDWIATLERSLYPVRTRRLKTRDLPSAAELAEDDFPFSDEADDVAY